MDVSTTQVTCHLLYQPVHTTSSSRQVTPGAKVKVTLRTTDSATGAPVPATVGVSITDEATRRLVEPLRRAPALEPALLLEGEVQRLGPGESYLSGDPSSDAALDLLLGTQGWRRFAFAVTPRQSIAACPGEAMRRALNLTLSQSDLAPQKPRKPTAKQRGIAEEGGQVEDDGGSLDGVTMQLAAFLPQRHGVLDYRKRRHQWREAAAQSWASVFPDRRLRAGETRADLPLVQVASALKAGLRVSWQRRVELRKATDDLLQSLPGYAEALALVGQSGKKVDETGRRQASPEDRGPTITFDVWEVLYLKLQLRFRTHRRGGEPPLIDGDPLLRETFDRHCIGASLPRACVAGLLRELCQAYDVSYDVDLDAFAALELATPAAVDVGLDDAERCFKMLVCISFDRIMMRPPSISAVEDVPMQVADLATSQGREASRIVQRLQSAVSVDSICRQRSEGVASSVMSSVELPPLVLSVWDATLRNNSQRLRTLLPRAASARRSELRDIGNWRWRGETLVHAAVRGCGGRALFVMGRGASHWCAHTPTQPRSPGEEAQDRCCEVISLLVSRGIAVGAKRESFVDGNTALHLAAGELMPEPRPTPEIQSTYRSRTHGSHVLCVLCGRAWAANRCRGSDRPRRESTRGERHWDLGSLCSGRWRPRVGCAGRT